MVLCAMNGDGGNAACGVCPTAVPQGNRWDDVRLLFVFDFALSRGTLSQDRGKVNKHTFYLWRRRCTPLSQRSWARRRGRSSCGAKRHATVQGESLRSRLSGCAHGLYRPFGSPAALLAPATAGGVTARRSSLTTRIGRQPATSATSNVAGSAGVKPDHERDVLPYRPGEHGRPLRRITRARHGA